MRITDEELIVWMRRAVEHLEIVGSGTFTHMLGLAAERLETLSSHEPAPADTQAGLGEAMKARVIAWQGYFPGAGSINSETNLTKSEYRSQEWERDGATVTALVTLASLTACQQEVETLREGIKEIAEREQSIRDNWARHEAETGARILELETELILRARKLHRITDALTPSRETKAAYMGEFHMGITLMHNGDEDHRRVMIPWTSIKEIMAAIRARAVLGGQSNG